MYWFLPFLVFSALLSSGMFFVRLDGSPNYAMLCNAIPAVVNILLDYVFIFYSQMGNDGCGAGYQSGVYFGGRNDCSLFKSQKKCDSFLPGET